jgi:hypothetical protein
MALISTITIDWDASPRIVLVPPPLVSVTIQDLVDTIRFLEAENIQYPKIVDTAGKTFLYNDGFADYFTGIVVTLQNAQIAFGARPGPAYVQCQITAGDLVAVDTNNLPISPVAPTAFTQLVISQSTSPSIVVTSGGVGTPADVADAVWDAAMASHLGAGTTGEKLNSAGSGGGSSDWTSPERDQIRFRLGLDGTQSTPATTTGTLPNVASRVWEEVALSHMTAGTMGEKVNLIKADTSSIAVSVVSIETMVNTILKYDKNRTKIDTLAKTLIVYDNDGVTPIQVFNLRDSNGQPSVVESYERIPTL